jgi:SAM-dependent methyltransferase
LSGGFDFGGLAGVTPITTDWGFPRGTPVDRMYIEQFLLRHRKDISGHVVEVSDNDYTMQFGEGPEIKSSVLDIRTDNPRATIIADLTNAPQIPDGTFDCVILTQVLIFIFDVEAALKTVVRTLRPGGVALITVPGISQMSAKADEYQTWSWSFYPETLRRLLIRHFDPRNLIVESFGNVKTTISFLAGLAQEDLAAEDFQHQDPRYPLIVAARAVRSDH